MKGWQAALSDSVVPGLVADLTTGAMIMMRGRRDSGSAVAPINASSHVLWGEQAARVERVTARHTLPGLLINAGAAIWWAFIFQKLFGEAADRRGSATALLGGGATALLAYVVDYHLLPRRLTPGWEQRLSDRSLFMSLGAMGLGIGLGATLTHRR